MRQCSARDGDLRAADAIDEQLTSEQSGVRRWYEAVGLLRATREPRAPAVRFRRSAASAVGALAAIVQGHPALPSSRSLKNPTRGIDSEAEF